MYLIGGSNGEVWDSTDGVNWNQVTSNAPFYYRQHHQVVAHNGKMYLFGGVSSDEDYNNDVWVSSDGVEWKQVNTCGCLGSKHHQVVAFQDKLYIVGGYDDDGNYNDIWYTSDGMTWTGVNGEPLFSERALSSGRDI